MYSLWKAYVEGLLKGNNVLYVHSDFGYSDLPPEMPISMESWSAFIGDAVGQILDRYVAYERPKPTVKTKPIEFHIESFNLTPKGEQYVDAVLDDLTEIIQDLTKKHGGYTELNLVKRFGGFQISALGDHRILEWHRGRGKSEPSPYLQELEQRREFNKALSHTTFSRAVVKPTPMKMPSQCAPTDAVVYIDGATAFLDAANINMVDKSGCEVRPALIGDTIYEVLESIKGDTSPIFGNWLGAGDVFCPLEAGDRFCINRYLGDREHPENEDPAALDRPVLSIL